jgi:hypothetical protein
MYHDGQSNYTALIVQIEEVPLALRGPLLVKVEIVDSLKCGTLASAGLMIDKPIQH